MLSEWAPVLVALVAGLTSAPVWNSAMRWLGRPQNELDRLRREVKESNQLHTDCEKRVDELGARIALIEHHHASQFARWIRDAQKRFIWVNDKAMLAIFAPLGRTRDEVYGKTFRDFLDPAACDEIDRLDQAALAMPGAPASNLIKLHPDLPLKYIVKVAGVGRDSELIYEGMAFRPNDPEIANGFGIARNAAQRMLSLEREADFKD